MKRLAWLLLPVSLVAVAAPVTVTWDPYPNTQATLHAECRVVGGVYQEIGAAPGTATSITADSGVDPGQDGECRVWATQGGFQDSPHSGVAAFTVPLPILPQPTGVRAAPQ